MKALSTSVIIMLTLATFAFARTITVDDNGPADFSTIQAAINDANDGDELVVSQGRYFENIDLLGKAIILRSTDPNDPCVVDDTIIDGNNLGSCITCDSNEDANTIIDGLFITNGNASSGGGLYCVDSSPVIKNCVLSENNAGNGGGIYIENGDTTIERCYVIGNSSDGIVGGGGIVSFGNSEPKISNCIIAQNSAEHGGGIFVWGETHGLPKPIIRNCTIVSNTASSGGGGIGLMMGSEPDIINSILWDNVAPAGEGHEIALFLVTDVWNTDPIISYCDIQGGKDEIKLLYTGFSLRWGSGNIDIDPCFADVDSNDFHLLWDSPCINAGDPNLSPEPNENDIDGEPRIMGCRVDIGVDEYAFTTPFIELWPTSFMFEAVEGGPNPLAQVLSIQNCGGGILNWQIDEECDWLQADPNFGSSTGEVNEVSLVVDISGLGGGLYDCELTVDDPCAQNSPQIVSVTLDVEGPVIELSSTSFSFSASMGGANPADQVLGISNTGGGTLNWQVSASCPWLTAIPAVGSSTGEVDDVNLSVDISGLGGGLYNCDLIISDPNAENSPQTVSVTLDVEGSVINLSSTSFSFSASMGGANPADQVLGISNTGSGALNWQVSESCSWLSEVPLAGSSTGEVDDVNLSVDITGLNWGVYDCNLTVSDPNAENSPQSVSVTLDIQGSVIELSSTSFSFNASMGGANPADQVLGISNTGSGTLNWQVSESCSWLSAAPLAGSCTGEVDDVNLSVDTTGLGWGCYNCELTVTDPNAENSPQIVTVNLAISDDINDCFPPCHPDYAEWVTVGKPESWCCPRHCHADADCAYETIGHGLFWVAFVDLGILVDNWADAQGCPAAYQADFSHSAETIGHSTYRVGFEDLYIIVDNWADGLDTPADCLDVPSGVHADGERDCPFVGSF